GRLRLERKHSAAPVIGEDEEAVIDEVELDLKRPVFVPDQRRADPAGCAMEGDVPGMIHPRRVHESDLSDDLWPEMQGRRSLAPFFVRKGRPLRDRAALRHDSPRARKANSMGQSIRPSDLHSPQGGRGEDIWTDER